MNMRGGWSIAALSVAAVGAAWVTMWLASSRAPSVIPMVGSRTESAPSAGASLDPEERRSDDLPEVSPVGGDGAAPPATRESAGTSGWEQLDDDLRLAAAGRARWLGVVLDREGRPCPEAELWHASRPIGRTDAAGRFDLEVEVPLRDGGYSGGPNERLAAWHPKAGSGAIEAPPRSALLELRLEWNTLAAGITVEAGTQRPIADATLDVMAFAETQAHGEPLFQFTARSDGAGAWSFPGLPATTLAMRARAKHHASAGWFSVGLPPQGDARNLTFELMPLITLRGWFTPWPPPGGVDGAGGARLFAQPLVKSDVRNEFERFELPLAAAGTFAAEVPVSLDSELLLVVEDLLRWSRQVDFDAGRREVDLGRIELDAGGFVEVAVDWPRDVLELGFEVLAWPTGATAFPRSSRALAPSGSVRIGPFGARELQVGIWFSGGSIYWDGARVPPLGGAEVHRWSPELLEPGDLVCCGRVTTPDGRPVAGADVVLVVPVEGGASQSGGMTDRLGRYRVATGRHARQNLVPRERSVELRVSHLLGFASCFVAAALPTAGAIRRLDVELPARPPLRGTLLTAASEPAAARWLTFEPLDGATAGDAVFGADCVTDAAGRFQAQPRGDRRFRVRCQGASQPEVEIGVIDRSAEPLVLQLPEPPPPIAPEARRSDALPDR